MGCLVRFGFQDSFYFAGKAIADVITLSVTLGYGEPKVFACGSCFVGCPLPLGRHFFDRHGSASYMLLADALVLDLRNPNRLHWHLPTRLHNMPTTAPQNAPVTFEPGVTQALQLIAGESTYQLGEEPLTIGGGPRCSVRLTGNGLRHLHCVVTQTEQGPVIRRWAADTKLNGADFSEATLTPGDAISVGGQAIQVVESLSQPELTSEVSNKPVVEPVAQPVAEPQSDALGGGLPAPECEPCEPAKDPTSALESLTDQLSSVDAEISIDDLAAGIEPAPEVGPAEVGQVESSAPSFADSDLQDPAIPAHLLQPWSPRPAATSEMHDSDSSAESPGAEDPFGWSESETDLNEEGLKDFSAEERADTEPDASESAAAESEATKTDPVEDAFAEEIIQGSETDSLPPTSSDMWSVDEDSDLSAHETESGDAEAAAQFAGGFDSDAALTAEVEPADCEPPAVDSATPVPSQEPVESVTAVESLAEMPNAAESSNTAQPITLESRDQVARQRVQSGRVRVSRLVAALREDRSTLSDLRSELQAKETEVASLFEQLESAVAAATDAGTQISQLQEELERLEASLEVAISERDALQTRAEELESKSLQASQEATAEPEVADTDADSFADNSTEPAQEPESASPAESLWSIEPTSTTNSTPDPAIDSSSPTSELETVAAETGEVEPSVVDPSEHEAVEESAEQAIESPWGIEKLATEASESDSLWDLPTSPSNETDPPAAEEAQPTAEGTLPEPTSNLAQVPQANEEFLAASEVPADSENGPVVENTETPVNEAEALAENAVASAFAAPQEDQGEPQPHQPPTSFIEKYAHLVPEDEEPTEPIPPVAQPSEPLAETATDTQEQEDSIDDYMAKLMARVRGEGSGPAVPISEEESGDLSEQVSAPPEASLEAAPVQEPEVEPEKEPIRDLSEMKRTEAPAVNTDMGALRQLANQSARQAIDVATTREKQERATLHMTISSVALACGALASVAATSVLSFQFLSGLAAVVAGGWYVIRGYGAFNKKKPVGTAPGIEPAQR